MRRKSITNTPIPQDAEPTELLQEGKYKQNKGTQKSEKKTQNGEKVEAAWEGEGLPFLTFLILVRNL